MADRPQAAPAAVPAVVAPPPGHPRFPGLDALRAVAALAVLFGHVAAVTRITREHWWSPLVARGDQGVTIFFILSGFLLYRPLVAARLGGPPRPAWDDYLRRRLLRVVPAYWLALTVLAVYPGLPGVFTGDWWAYYGFVQAYGDHALGGLFIAWTLNVEVSFYLVLPLYALAVGRLTRGLGLRGRVGAELAVLGVMSVASLALHYLDPSFPNALPQYWLWFAEGMALALISAAVVATDGEPGPGARIVAFVARRPGACWAAAAALYLLLAAGLGTPTDAGNSVGEQVAYGRIVGGAMAALLVLPAVFGPAEGGWPRRVMAWPPLAWLGLISYGLYLWHLGVLDALAEHVVVNGNDGLRAFVVLGVATFAVTVAAAAASYYLLGRPLLRLKVRRAPASPPAVEARPSMR